MSEARPTFFDFDVTKMMADFRFRPFDLEAVMAYQRRNIEALSQANQLAVEGMQAVAKRQIEITRQAIEDVSALLRDLAQPGKVGLHQPGASLLYEALQALARDSQGNGVDVQAKQSYVVSLLQDGCRMPTRPDRAVDIDPAGLYTKPV